MLLVIDSFTLLPRLTLRHYENKQTGRNGLGNTELEGMHESGELSDPTASMGIAIE